MPYTYVHIQVKYSITQEHLILRIEIISMHAYSMFMSFKDVTLIVDTMFLYVEKEYKKKITNLYEI